MNMTFFTIHNKQTENPIIGKLFALVDVIFDWQYWYGKNIPNSIDSSVLLALKRPIAEFWLPTAFKYRSNLDLKETYLSIYQFVTRTGFTWDGRLPSSLCLVSLGLMHFCWWRHNIFGKKNVLWLFISSTYSKHRSLFFA